MKTVKLLLDCFSIQTTKKRIVEGLEFKDLDFSQPLP